MSASDSPSSAQNVDPYLEHAKQISRENMEARFWEILERYDIPQAHAEQLIHDSLLAGLALSDFEIIAGRWAEQYAIDPKQEDPPESELAEIFP
jgi:hypothetical protein